MIIDLISLSIETILDLHNFIQSKGNDFDSYCENSVTSVQRIEIGKVICQYLDRMAKRGSSKI